MELGAEVRIPLDPTPAQAAAYRTVLTRSYELLADAKPSRHAGYRAAQMRNVCLELRKVGGLGGARMQSVVVSDLCWALWGLLHAVRPGGA